MASAAGEPVVLIAAPFLSLQRPALGLSLLKAALAERGIAARCEYLNLSFAEVITPELSQKIAQTMPSQHLIGDWVFAHLIRGAGADHDLADGEDWVREKLKPEVAAQVIAARTHACSFVAAAARTIVASKPRVVGFSTSFQQNCASLALAARIKALNPEILICFGGANCEDSMGRQMLRSFAQVDVAFSGEADKTFPDFVEHYLGAALPKDSPRFISGAPIQDMDALPVPDFSDYFAHATAVSFADRIVPAIAFESSRGCWWGAKHHCTFCGLNGDGMGFRAKSTERVIEEIRTLHAKWDVPRFIATDTIIHMPHIADLFSRYADELADFRILYEIKSNASEAQLRTLAEAGVTYVQPGIESLDDDILRLMRKGVTGMQNICLLRNCNEIGTRVFWNMLCGFPGEDSKTYDEMAKVIGLIQHLEPPHGPSKIRIDRFSPFHVTPRELGFENVRPARAYGLIYDLPEEALREFAYFFEGDRIDGGDVRDYVGGLTKALNRWRQRATGDARSAHLRLSKLGPLTMVYDTRDCAVEEHRPLNEAEAEVLFSFDKPENVSRQIGRLRKTWQHEQDPQACFDELVRVGFLLVDKGRALRLVTVPDIKVRDWDSHQHFPSGRLLPAQATEKAIA
jgi:ribosomal peptide maturation radical SAM protein 1